MVNRKTKSFLSKALDDHLHSMQPSAKYSGCVKQVHPEKRTWSVPQEAAPTITQPAPMKLTQIGLLIAPGVPKTPPPRTRTPPSKEATKSHELETTMLQDNQKTTTNRDQANVAELAEYRTLNSFIELDDTEANLVLMQKRKDHQLQQVRQEQGEYNKTLQNMADEDSAASATARRLRNERHVQLQADLAHIERRRLAAKNDRATFLATAYEQAQVEKGNVREMQKEVTIYFCKWFEFSK